MQSCKDSRGRLPVFYVRDVKMAAKKKPKSRRQVNSLRHSDKRKNIPTEELRDFVKEEESQPEKVTYPGLLYARDPSLDPQLVWTGKDDQDREDLTVPSVPIYIQEKIHPQAIIEDVRARAKANKPEAQLDLFAQFNGISFEDQIDFYHHEANWSNRMILGDSLLAMTSLAEKENLKGQVQVIYIDPPYGIRFGSNWQVSTRKRDVGSSNAKDVTRQPEQIRAFRDTWKLGIHSYLAYWRDRLILARELLTSAGSIFVQIGDENVHLVRSILDEVFGTDNFCAMVSFTKTGGFSSSLLSSITDYLVWYAKDRGLVKYRQLLYEKEIGHEGAGQYIWAQMTDGSIRQLTDDELYDPSVIEPTTRIFSHQGVASQGASATSATRHYFQGQAFKLPASSHWKTTPEGMGRLRKADRFMAMGNSLRYKRFISDFAALPINNVWTDTGTSGFADKKMYVVQTNPKAVERCLLMTTDPGDLILDPTCGSGTTAYVAEQWGRRWITIDTSRVALALARTRLMAAKYPYYLLADSPDGRKKEAEITGQFLPDQNTEGDIKKGFVYNRVPHIKLKAIANNEEIDDIHSRWQMKLEPLLEKINAAAGEAYEEWELPRQAPDEWPAKAEKLLDEWWKLRRKRQEEIDGSIARNADTELLYDQPYEDKKRIRVTGPFTVESLSPHRRIALDTKIRESTVGIDGVLVRELGAGQFGMTIIENLKKAGVQNTVKNERLKFERLEPFAGLWVHAEGEYTEKDGTSQRVAVCIGPEHGTVGPELVKEAAKEAVQGIGFDLLIICGFAFDPHVSEEAKRYGNLTILPARINADLQMGDEFLKKTGAGNLFMVFGEPDIEVTKQKDGRITAEIKGLDIYDPTTGQIRSNSTDDIACWFIDTNYNGESFFVRHAYFTGADRPYEKLQRALKAEIDEAAWSQLYSTTSRPFDIPNTGKIAVKVINHYGDEVLKVYDV